jgi:hypothetical protein
MIVPPLTTSTFPRAIPIAIIIATIAAPIAKISSVSILQWRPRALSSINSNRSYAGKKVRVGLIVLSGYVLLLETSIKSSSADYGSKGSTTTNDDERKGEQGFIRN